MVTLVGKSIGRYNIVEELGTGGMAAVYKAFDTRLERYVAVKVILTDPIRAEQMLRRFEREAKALARLTHPNIVKVHDFGEQDGLPYLVMDYIPGGTLKDRVKGTVPWNEAARILVPIARALEYAHQKGVVHRDVKPANILISASGDPMLSDFGIAKIVSGDGATSLTNTGMGIGTPEYMAPEQWMGQARPQTDIYALGVVFYELVTGRKPYTETTPAAILLKQSTGELPSPRQFVPTLPLQVERVILKAMAKNPENRYGSMAEFVSVLEILGNEKIPVQREGAKLKIKQLIPVMLGMVALFFVFCLVVGLVVAREPITKALGLLPATPRELRMTHTPRSTATTAKTTPLPKTQTTIPSLTVSLTLINGVSLTPSLPFSPTPIPTLSDTPTITLIPEKLYPAGLIAYVSGVDGKWIIYIADPESDKIWKLPGQPVNSGVPAWFPGGESLLLRSNASGIWQIYRINLDGSSLVQLTSDGNNYEASVSPDGSSIAFVSERDNDKEIYVMNTDGTNQTRLTASGGWDDDPCWSPDGQWIIYESKRSGKMNVYKMRADGSEVTNLTGDLEFGGTPAWSPDGNWIAFESLINGNYHIWLMKPDGSKKRQLTKDGTRNYRPAWSPDSMQIAYTSNRDGTYAIWVIPVDGSSILRRITPTEGFDSAWSH